MRIGEKRKKVYMLATDESQAIMKVIGIVERLNEDEDFTDRIETGAAASMRDTSDVLSEVLNLYFEEI